MTSWAPTPSTDTSRPSRCSRTSPDRSSAGNLFGTHRILQPGPSAVPPSRYARTSGGVIPSWPSQNGQSAFGVASFGFRKTPGRWDRAAEKTTQVGVAQSLRISDMQGLYGTREPRHLTVTYALPRRLAPA